VCVLVWCGGVCVYVCGLCVCGVCLFVCVGVVCGCVCVCEGRVDDYYVVVFIMRNAEFWLLY